jgi:hypothetical protein
MSPRRHAPRPPQEGGASAATWENVQYCCDLLSPSFAALSRPLRVLEIARTASYRTAIPWSGDHTRLSPDEVDSARGPFDLIVTTAADSDVTSLVQALGPGGFLVAVTPSRNVAAPHLTPDDYAQWARQTGTHLIWCELDSRGTRHDVLGIFARTKERLPERPARNHPVAPKAPRGRPEEESWRGEISYLDALADLHQQLAPRLYLEIGVHRGQSLRLATCPAVAVDPDPRVTSGQPNVTLFNETSDDFFRFDASAILGRDVDLAFIDGMHLFEYALRDFMHTETHCHSASVIVFDDVLPCHPVQARRDRATMAWCGDVWKVIDCLSRYRPGLDLMLLDTAPTGLLLVSGLDADNRALWEAYDEILARYQPDDEPPPEVVERRAALPPLGHDVQQLTARLRSAREQA